MPTLLRKSVLLTFVLPHASFSTQPQYRNGRTHENKPLSLCSRKLTRL